MPGSSDNHKQVEIEWLPRCLWLYVVPKFKLREILPKLLPELCQAIPPKNDNPINPPVTIILSRNKLPFLSQTPRAFPSPPPFPPALVCHLLISCWGDGVSMNPLHQVPSHARPRYVSVDAAKSPSVVRRFRHSAFSGHRENLVTKPLHNSQHHGLFRGV